MGKSHKGPTTTTTNAPDKQTQDWTKSIYQNAQQAAGQGPAPITGLATGAGDYNTSAQHAGQTGLNALAGDPSAVQGLMNPYQQQVMDQMSKQWGNINQQTQNQVNDRATQAGAFGGSRQAIATGSALSQNNQAQAAQQAQLLSGGYNQAMQQANSLANFGQQGASANQNFAPWMQQQQQMQQNPALWRMGVLQQGLQGSPYGTTSTSQTTTPGGGWQGAIGGALSGFASGGPWGALAGGVMGAM